VCYPLIIVPCNHPFLLTLFAIAVLETFSNLPYNNKQGNESIADLPAPD